MMYQWRITYWMKNCQIHMGIYEGPENDSLSVIRKLMNCKQNDFISHYGMDKNHMIGVKAGEIVGFDISPLEGENNGAC